MLRRLFLVAVLLCLVVQPVASHADMETIFDSLKVLNGSSRLADPASAEAQATAREFFKAVQSEPGGQSVINKLKELKSRNGHRWSQVERAENALMAVVKRTLEGQIRGVIEGRVGNGSLGSINAYGYSGKWPLKPTNQLTFDGDFDVTFFSAVGAEVNPDLKTSIVGELTGNIKNLLGVDPAGLSIVINGAGFEERADVYVSKAAIKWAVIQSMTKLYLIDGATGQSIEITGAPEKLFAAVQLQLLERSHPELFEKGQLKPGITPEKVKELLANDPAVSGTYKIFLEGTSYTPGQAAAATIDMACHTSETSEATTALEIRTKVAKQLARSSNIFVNAMNTTQGEWRQFFSAEDLQFMREAATLDRAKMTYAEAESKRIRFLLDSRLMGSLTDAQQAEYQKLKSQAEQAAADLRAIESDVMRRAGGEAEFTQKAVELMRRQGQVAHREYIISILSMPAAERARALAEYEAELRRVLEHYKKRGAPAETIAWAERAADSAKELARINQENAKAMEGVGAKLIRIYEMFNNPVNTREKVKSILGETPMGKALLERVPEWAFAKERPPALTDIAFDAPTKIVAEVVVAPVNQTVNALMMIDLLLQLSDVWSGNQTDVQKLVSTGEVVAMMVVPHLYLVPAVYHASLTGDPKQLAYVVACYICPPAMLPMLVDSLGTRVISAAKRALFQSELEAMFQASIFKPADGQEPKDWENNRDAVKYTWISLETGMDSYGRSGQRTLATYIRILASDTREEIPLSQPKKMSGLQAIYLPGGVAKSFRAMIEDGDHRLFKENQALAEALSNLQKFNCDRLVPYMDKAPAYCRYAWAEQKNGVRLDLINNTFADGEVARLKAEGKPGESMVKIVQTMLDQRAKLQNDVVEHLAEAIIISFEEEKRARKLVELGLLDENLKELLEIGRELAIQDELKDAVSEALRKEGVKLTPDQMDKTTGKLNDKARQDIAKVTDQWLKSYRYVVETRRSLAGITAGYGVPKTEIDHFLRGKPPLQVIPGADVQSTQTSREVIMNSPKDASGILFRLKGDSREPNPLDSEAEATLLKYLFTARIMELTVDQPYTMIPLWQEGPAEGEKPEAFAERARGELQKSLDMKNKSFWGSPPDFSAYLDRYYLLARGYAEKFAELRERYRSDIQIAIDGPKEVEAEKDVSLKVVPTRKGKPAEDALKDARIEWVVNKSVKNSGMTWWFSPLKEETMSITVNAVRDVKGKPVILATTTHQLVVKKKQEEKKPADKKTDEGATGGAAATGGTIKLIVPSTARSTEIFDVSAAVPDGVKAWAKGYAWSGPLLSESDDRLSAKMQYGPRDSGNFRISVTANGTSPDGATARGEAAIAVKAVSFEGAGSDLWEGGANPGGFSVKRKPVIRKRKNPDNFMSSPGQVVDSGNVTATLSVAWMDSPGPKTEDELKKTVQGSSLWQSLPDHAQFETELKDFALGDFKGYILETKKVVTRYGASEYQDMGFPSAGVAGRGILRKGNVYLGIFYNAFGGGMSLGKWWDDMPFLEGEVGAAWGEIRSMLGGLRIVADGKFTRYPHPVVKLTAIPDPSRKYRIGEPVTLRATVENPPPGADPKTFVYSWTGYVGSGDTITLSPVKPGRQQVSVAVTGIGSASIDIDVEEIQAVIVKTAPSANTIPVGSKATLAARLTSGGREVTGKYVYRWQPNTEVAFDAAEGPDNKTTATFKRPGKTRLWVDVLMKEGDVLTTVARSENLDLDIVEPKLSLTAQPASAMAGQEVSIKVSSQVPAEDMDFRWEVAGSAKTLRESQDTREIVIRLLDDKPVTVTARGQTRRTGDSLGEAKQTITAKKYAVNVTGPRAMGPKPKVWKEGVGLVDVENAIAVDQVVEFAADTQPAALTGPVKYQWKVAGGSCTVSNPISREARATASAAGGCELTVVIQDKNDVPLGEGKGRFDATVTRETIVAGQKKAKDVADTKTKLADAKAKARKGDYDGAIKDAEDAAKLDPANRDAADTAGKLRQERDTIHQQIGRANKLMDENKFADAQKELIVASNLNSYYPPVAQANLELGTRWGKYNSEVRDKVYEVRSANERKDFGKALEIAAAWRASTKLDPYADKELKQQEDWAKQWQARKDRQFGILKEAGQKVKNYDYAGALKQYDEGFANGQNIYNGSEPEYKEAVELRGQAFTKNKRLGELIPWIQRAAESKESMPVDTFQNALKSADEAIALQPTNEQLKKWRERIVARSTKTNEDNERIAAGRKYLDAAGNAERSFANNESYVKANPGQWGETLEEQQQLYLTTAIQNYTESLKYIPDAAVEKKIKDLRATLEGRQKYLEQYRTSRTLLAEADALYKQATQDADIQSASPKYDEAAAKYRKSLSLYRPFNAENIEKTIYVLEQYKHERWVKKYWADGQELEKQGKLIEALAAYDKAIASLHPTTDQRSRLWYETQAQELRNKINGAKTWRADGEAKQKAGKIAEAIASYKQSLALLPDAALAEYVRMLDGKQAETGEKKATADRLWQEGTALFNQGRPSDALTKFKESLGYFSDATRSKYVADMEARRAKASALRDEGAKLQGQNRISEAIAKYKESQSQWPDPGLASHIATLEGKLKQDADAAARKAKAKQLRDEGYALQQKNQLQAAVGKYKESLAIWPDPQLEDYVRQLEAKIVASSAPASISKPAQTTVPATSSTQKPGSPAAEISTGSWTGTWRSENRPNDPTDYVLTQSGNRVTGTYTVNAMVKIGTDPAQKVVLKGRIEGTVSGNTLRGTYTDADDTAGPTGQIEFVMNPDGNTCRVNVRNAAANENWTARRIGAASTPGR